MTIREGGPLPNVAFADGTETPPFHGWIASPPVDAETLPRTLTGTDVDRLPDAFSVGGMNCVSERLKAVLVAAEPDIHQFFPLAAEDGTPVAHIFHVTRSVACVLASESGMQAKGVVKHGPNAGQPYYLCHDDELVISAPTLGGARIFSTEVIAPGSLIVPDEVGEAVQDQGMTGLRMHPAALSQTPWVLEEQAPELAEFLKNRGTPGGS